MKIVLFYLFALAAVIFGVLMITRRNPINSAISLLGAFVSFAALYILLNAQFIAVIQITIYAGAILVLILFTIMLLRIREVGEGFFDITSGAQRAAAIVLSLALFLLLVYALLHSAGVIGKVGSDLAEVPELGPTQTLAKKLFSAYIYPFEVASVLLLVGVVGAYILTRRLREPEQVSEEPSEQEGD